MAAAGVMRIAVMTGRRGALRNGDQSAGRHRPDGRGRYCRPVCWRSGRGWQVPPLPARERAQAEEVGLVHPVRACDQVGAFRAERGLRQGSGHVQGADVGRRHVGRGACRAAARAQGGREARRDGAQDRGAAGGREGEAAVGPGARGGRECVPRAQAGAGLRAAVSEWLGAGASAQHRGRAGRVPVHRCRGRQALQHRYGEARRVPYPGQCGRGRYDPVRRGLRDLRVGAPGHALAGGVLLRLGQPGAGGRGLSQAVPRRPLRAAGGR